MKKCVLHDLGCAVHSEQLIQKSLVMGRVFDMLNDVYGHDFIRYK